MADLTIHELQNEATTPAADDYAMLDGATAGTRKITPANLATWIHNKWAAFVNALTAKTSFASGDKLPVVNGTTATAMEASKLLELTAQNALAGNVAPEFDESGNTTYKAGVPVSRKGKTYIFKVAHSGVWSDSDVLQKDSTEFYKSNQCKVSDASLFVASKDNVGVAVDIFPHNRNIWEQGSFDNSGHETETDTRLRTNDYIAMPKRRFASSADFVQKLIVNVNTPNVQIDVLGFKADGTYRIHSGYLTGTNNVVDFSSESGAITKIRLLLQTDISISSRAENVIETEGIDISVIPYDNFVEYQDRMDDSTRNYILGNSEDLISKNPLFWVQGGEGSGGSVRTYANSRIGLWYVPIVDTRTIDFVFDNSGHDCSVFFYDASKTRVLAVNSGGWITESFSVKPPINTKYMTVIVRNHDNSAISTVDAGSIGISCSYTDKVVNNQRLFDCVLANVGFKQDFFPHSTALWEQGSINSGTGAETTSTQRLRTGYIDLPKKIGTTVDDFETLFTVSINASGILAGFYFYDANNSFLGFRELSASGSIDLSAYYGRAAKCRFWLNTNTEASRDENPHEVENIDISIIPSASSKSEQSVINGYLIDDYLMNQDDLMVRQPSLWVQGGEGSGGSVRTYANSRIGLWYVPIRNKTIKFEVASGSLYSIEAFFYNAAKSVVGSLSNNWVNQTTTYTPSAATKYMTVIVRKNDNSSITPSDIADVTIKAYYDNSVANGNVKTRLKLCTFNLGHFDYGNSNGIPAETLSAKLAKWKEFIAENNCDIIGLQECYRNVDKAGAITSMSLFEPVYPNDCGETDWTRLKTQFAISNYEEITFSTGRGYSIKCDMDVNGKTIKVYNVHLTPGQSEEAAAKRASEITELIAELANQSSFICFGDFNVRPLTEFAPFIAAGFKIANGGYLPAVYTVTSDSSSWATWPDSTGYTVDYSDNIVVSSDITIKHACGLNTYADLTSDHIPILAEVVV